MHGISYRPTDLSLLKKFSKKISFKDFHNFIWTRLSRSSGSCPSLSLQSYAANAASMQPQGRYSNCKLGTYWGFRGQPKSAQIVQIVQISTQVVSTLKYNIFLFRLTMVFCYQNCSDLLWEKIVLVVEKNFWNLRLKAENLQKIGDH